MAGASTSGTGGYSVSPAYIVFAGASAGSTSKAISTAGGPGWIATELSICDTGDPQRPLTVATACSINSEVLPSPTTQQEFVTSFVGYWIACNRPTIFGTNELGIEINPDGNYYQLYDEGACSVRRGVGFNEQGTWDVGMTTQADGQPHFQLYFHVAGGDGLGGDIAVEGAGRLRLTSDTPSSPTDYVLWQGPVP